MAAQAAELRSLKRLARRRAELEISLRRAILDAHAAGHSLRTIGEAADLSHVAIMNIVRREA